MERDLRNSSSKHSSFSSEKNRPKIWVVASGKGGVGKSFVASSLGITLAKMGHSTVIADLDLSGANIHTSLGMNPSFMNIRQYFEGSKSLAELIIPTEIPRLSYIQGFWDSWVPTDFSREQIERIIPDLSSLRADYVIVDLGAGAMEGHLELFLHADEKFLITTPEPSSIEKTYRFLEAFVCHTLKQDSQPDAYQQMIGTLRMHRQRSLTSPFSFKTYLKNQEGVRYDYFDGLCKKPVRLIVNQSRSMQNDELGPAIKSVCRKYYDLNIDFAGAIEYDNAVWQSARSREPVLIAQPFTPLAGQFLATCKQLIAPEELKAVV